MKLKFILAICLFILSFNTQAQYVSASTIQAINNLVLAGKKVNGISNDTTMTQNDSVKMSTQYAIKSYVDNHIPKFGASSSGCDSSDYGGFVTRNSLLNFNITTSRYCIGGKPRTSVGKSFSIDTIISKPRIDVVVGDTLGNVTVLKGTESVNPVMPQPSSYQHYFTSIFLGQDTTVYYQNPLSIGVADIYKKPGTDSVFKKIDGLTHFVTRVVDTTNNYHWLGSHNFDNPVTRFGRVGTPSSIILEGSGGADPNWYTQWSVNSAGADISYGTYTQKAVYHFGTGFYPNTGNGFLVMTMGQNSKSYINSLNLGYNQGTVKIGGDGVVWGAGAELDIFDYPNHRALPPLRFNFTTLNVLKDTVVVGAMEPLMDSLYYTGTSVVRKRLAYANEIGVINTKATDPTTADIPVGDFKVYYNSTTNTTYLWANVSGVLFKVQLL